MKLINKLLLSFFLGCGTVSCNYLDIVPDEKATEADAFKNPQAALRYLYSCYAYIPDPRHASSSLDLLTGDDIVTPWEHESFGKFVRGTYTPSNPIINYWHDLYKGIRQCYLFRENVNSVPGLSDDLKAEYSAEIDFLVAYYHYILLRTYGPCIIIDGVFDVNNLGDPENFLARTPYDKCVSWISEQFKTVAGKLPATREGEEYGRATSVAAMAIRARMLLYAASPQFNGGEKFVSMYSDFVNKDGEQLISTTYNPQKWVDAAQACLEAITLAEDSGYDLYKGNGPANAKEPTDPTVRKLRYVFVDKDNTKEVLWPRCSDDGGVYGIQGKSVPRWGQYSWGGMALTLRQVERFYTENGLPIEVDPEFDYQGRYSVADFPADANYGQNFAKNATGSPEGTVKLNLHREPRFYSWVAFHNGYFEFNGVDEDTKSTNAFAKKYLPDPNNTAKHIVQFTKLSNQGLTSSNTQGTLTGYLNKKGVDPQGTVSTAGGLKLYQYPWPIVRLGELYLNYAEACVECNDLETAKTCLNKIRNRAGIPSVEESWAMVPGVVLDQNKMREIVRQERQIELYLENHNFYDIRRWGVAEVLGERPMGLDVKQESLTNFVKPKEVEVSRNFIPAHYLMPLPINEINKNPNLVQNPGYAEVE